MPPKRQVTIQSDSEDESERGSPKRQRSDPLSDRDAPGPSQPTQTQDNDSSDDEGDIVIPIAAEDADFDRENIDKVRAAIQAGKNTVKGIAEYGLVQAIELEDFMCHKKLNFEFGQQINFIIGHNGSGKSAVLSALTVALGGKTTSTGRGTGLKSLIREGQHQATVTLKIKNEGPEAYRHDVYGDSIVIRRRFNVDGNTTWRIMDATGTTTVSNKKEELSAICDHMNIQVDNPINVLTQDSARMFLGASPPKEKYKLFLLGTQLYQLSTEYEACLESIGRTERVLASKHESIPDLERLHKAASARLKEAEKARRQEEKVHELRQELAWAHVAEKGAELEEKLADVATKEGRIPKIEESLRVSEEELVAQEEVVHACEGELDNVGSVDTLLNRKGKLVKEVREHTKKIQGYDSEFKRIDASILELEQTVKDLEQQIADEELRMATDTQAKRDELDQRLAEVKKEVDTLDAKMKDINERKRVLMVANDETQAAGKKVADEIGGLQQRIAEADNMILGARQSMKDMFVPYGNNIKAVVEEIERAKWHGDKPLGPLGRYVKVKEPEKWGAVLRNQLQGILTSFAITDPRDRDQLKRILARDKNYNSILISERDIFDYSEGEPPKEYHTVLRALEFSDPWALRLMIDRASIERVVLSPKRKPLEEALLRLRGGGTGWTLDEFFVRVYPDGGIQSNGLNMNRVRGAQNLLLSGRNPEAEIAHHEQKKAEFVAQVQQLQQRLNAHKAEFATRKAEIGLLDNEGRVINDQLRQARARLSQLQEEVNEEMPTDIAGFVSVKNETEEDIANHRSQRVAVEEEKAKSVSAKREFEREIETIEAQIAEFNEKHEKVEEALRKAVLLRVEKQHAVTHYNGKLKEEKEELAQAQAHAKVTQEEFENWSEGALRLCHDERIETDRKPEEIEREMKSTKKALEQRKATADKRGASIDDLAAEVDKCWTVMNKAKREWKQTNRLNRALKRAIITRLRRWVEFRSHIALRTKINFGYHLSNRGYFGKVDFNHTEQTLQLKVQTDDQANKGSGEKDPKSLSGGEKSFSTICLLLSLWDAISCPLRCLDEFDVFMDAVNRRISMKMMIETATENSNKQYILITPQDMTNVHIGDNVKVSRMDDPQRGAGLNMAAG
ncbi:hypothetical protein DFP72DRAFT_916170 [Ephemerocybe angulata]|uniref:RecF/RecN/SMC N-terminal domain-containing protein n=1 Tax=Ephemerocybe angulata TaxID=980116 RepID=A0A8H6HKR1_9AGAR|nr:hypothetical protein DFP72DRAFT_916170 [Tulosesus angulatus]